MSVPTNQTPEASQPNKTGNRESLRRPAAWSRRYYWLLLFAVIVPTALLQAPREVGRWQLAAALNLRSKGEKDVAYQKLAAAMEWFPSSPELLLQRAEWRLEDGQRDEALADCDKMLELGNKESDLVVAHGLFMLKAGEFQRSIEDWKVVDKFSSRSGKPKRETALNMLAYSQALAEIDLDEALQRATEALELQPESEGIRDTHAYILHLQGDDTKALEELDRAVKEIDVTMVKIRQGIGRMPRLPQEYRKLSQSLPQSLQQAREDISNGSTTTTPDPMKIEASITEAAAVIHYHRALALEALGRHDEAKTERATVRQLIGREPDKTLY
jgi:tetratricopeptide (TPR) repeat protein